MSIFATVAPIQSVESDVLRAGGKFTLDSGVYDAMIKMAFVEKSKTSASQGVKFEFAINKDGKIRRHFETIWFMGRDGKMTRVNKDGKEVPTVGMEQLDAIAKLTLGTGVETLVPTACQVEIKKGEALQTRDVFRQLIGHKIKLGIKEVKSNKQVQDHTGKWVNGPEEKLENKVDKYFNAEGKTLAEQVNNVPATFVEVWKAEFEGKLIDMFKPVAGGVSAGATAVQSSSSLI